MNRLREIGTDPLPESSVACRHCGRAVPRDGARIDTLSSSGYRPTGEQREAWERQQREERARRERWATVPARPGEDTVPAPVGRFEFTVCDRCAATLQRAERLVADHRRLIPAVGTVFSGRVETALMRLDMLDDALTDADAAAMSDGDVLLLANRMGLGHLPRWADKFTPVYAGGDPASCAAEPWAHVGGDPRAAALVSWRSWKAAQLQARRARVSPPRMKRCPTRACMLCGIGESMGWEAFKASAVQLGGRGGGTVSGHLCDVCSEVHRMVHSVGPSLLERSLLAHRDPGGRFRGLELDGLVAWCVAGAPVNVKPWGHLRPSDALTARLLGEEWVDLDPVARDALRAVSGRLSDDAAAELRSVLGAR